MKARIAVFVSGGGTNLQALIDAQKSGIITDGEIVKADVCTDVEYADCKYLTKMLRANVSNYSKYLARVISGNFVIEKNVQTKGYKRILTIYDKFKEISKACSALSRVCWAVKQHYPILISS